MCVLQLYMCDCLSGSLSGQVRMSVSGVLHHTPTHARTFSLFFIRSFNELSSLSLSLPLSDLPFLSNTLSLVVKHSMAVWLRSLMEARSHEEYQAAFFFCLRAKLLAMSDRHHSQ